MQLVESSEVGYLTNNKIQLRGSVISCINALNLTDPDSLHAPQYNPVINILQVAQPYYATLSLHIGYLATVHLRLICARFESLSE